MRNNSRINRVEGEIGAWMIIALIVLFVYDFSGIGADMIRELIKHLF